MSLKDAIREAAGERDKQENANQEKTEPGAQQSDFAANTANSKAVGTASSKAIKAAKSKTAKLASTETPVTANTFKDPAAVIPPATGAAESANEEIELAALTVRVPRKSRIHWLVTAKKQETTLTAAIIEALNERFGTAEE